MNTAPKMYTKYRGDAPVAYRYGDELEAIKLFVDGGYPTKEEAIEAWERFEKVVE